MRRSIILFVFALISMIKLSAQQAEENLDFPLGEKIKFKIYYGWFALGEAQMELADSVTYIENKPHYYSHISARTIGLFSWLAGIDNHYMGYVNTENYKATITEKHLSTRKGIYDQWNTFDYNRMQTDVKIMDYSKNVPEKNIIVKLKEQTYDLHGTYMFLRSKLWSGFEKGDSVLINTYWEDKLYDFGMEYAGTERIKYKGDKITTHKFYALFPVTSTFPKEKAVSVWVMEKEGMSIPIQIEADMKIGKVRCELKEYMVRGKSVLSD